MNLVGLKPGARVRFTFTFMAAEQGQRFETEWPGEADGTVVSVTHDKVLLELQDGARAWHDLAAIAEIYP